MNFINRSQNQQMNNFFDLLVFIGGLYKLAVTMLIIYVIGIALVAIFYALVNFFSWVF